ncbi:pore complex protein Nup98-Nup96 [Seminavis robusta]|uniref:Pore complex protein Nup98-Nup96 n=1 Tax=Seminavis robusta TaxID=568900 RepID=A0A9N8EMX5_9STRA|nr:pore complex protein Nup98-Nup96 [Seminavis robusta]|eukprot:Sro1496_g277550.1 pore complex protein Nup98-Nup96 (1036) ;mRNA; f:23990-28068
MFGAPANNSPFGSPPPTGGFGSPSPAPFGAPAPAFGAPAFGTPAPAPAFGAPSTGFGAPAPAPGGFGASTFGGGATSTFGGGGFGAPAPAPAFGGGGFGATNNASPFGAPAPAPGGLFGAPAPAPSGGLFGAPAPAPAFGASPAPAFGASTFGAPAPTPAFGASTFGAPAPSTGLFGAAPTPAPSAFGSTFGASPAPAFGAPAPPPGSIFGGAPAPAPGGLFGAPAAAAPGQPGGGGSKQTPYQPTPRQDGTSTIQMQSISAMPAYENKNFDELRYEDYLQGNKGAGNAASTGFGGFGAPAPSGAPFGAPAPAPFGAPAPAFGSTFGAPAPAPPAFGATPAPAFGSSTFGKPATGSLFGAPAPAQGGLFGGGSPAAAPAFGAPAPAPGGLFGAPAPAPGGLFGAPAPGGLFGSTPAPAFGAPAPPPAFGFGAPAPGGGLFGPAPAPAFGATPAPGGLFGAPAPPAGSLFGAKPPGTGLFGAPAPAAFGSPPTAFGAPTAAAPSLFGSPPAMAAAPMMIPAGAIIPQAASEVLSHQIQALENKRKEVQKLDVWRTKSPEESRVTPVSQPQYGGLASGLVRSSPYTPHRHNPGSAAKKLRPRGFGSAIAAPSSSASPLDTMGTGGRAMMSPEAYVSSSAKKLVIKQDSLTPKPKLQLRLMNAPSSASDVTTHALPVSLEAESPAPGNAGPSIATAPPASSPSPRQSQMQTSTPTSVPVFGNEANAGTPTSPTVNGGSRIPPVTAEKIDPPPPDPDRDYYQQVVDSPDGNPADRPAPQSARVTKKKPSYLPKLTKPGYVITPSLDELATLSEADLAAVSNFSIRCDPYGLVEWKGAVDVRNADLDNSIVIGQNDVSVYTKDEEEGRKPLVGSKLNRPAVITFFNVFPKNGGANASVEDKVKFARRIERQTVKMDAELIKYDKDTGSWKIAVGHFSRYGLSDDDESEDELYTESVEKEDDAAIVSDVEMDHHVEEAFDSIYSAVKSYSKHPKTSLHDDMELSEEQTDDCDFDEYYESPDCRSMGFSTTLISADDYDKGE